MRLLNEDQLEELMDAMIRDMVEYELTGIEVLFWMIEEIPQLEAMVYIRNE